MLKFSPLIMLSASLLGLFPLQSASAQTFEPIEFIIDDFISPQNAIATGAATGPTAGNRLVGNTLNPTQSVIGPMGTMGSERDLFVQKTQGAQNEQVNVQINPQGEDLLRMSIGQARGRTLIVWDGVDGLPRPSDPDVPPPAQVDFDGLGGINFNIYEALEILIAFSDLGGPINFTFWDATDLTGNTFARTTFNVPGMIEADPEADPIIPPSLFRNEFNTTNFTVTGPASLTEILSRVGAIQMEIDGTLVTGWDMNVDLVRVVGQQEVPEPPSVPEPSTVISLLALGALPLSKKLKDFKKQS